MQSTTIPNILENMIQTSLGYSYKNLIAVPFNHFKRDCLWMVCITIEKDIHYLMSKEEKDIYSLMIEATQIEDACAMALYWVLKIDD